MTHSWQGFVLLALAASATASLVGCNAETDRMRPADAMVKGEGTEEPDDATNPPDLPSDGTPDVGPTELPVEFPIEPPHEEPSLPDEVSPADPPESFPQYPPAARKGDPTEPSFPEYPPLETPHKGDPSGSYPDWPDGISKSGDGGEHVGPRPDIASRPRDPVDYPHYEPPVEPPPSHLAGQPRFPVAGAPGAGMAAQVPPRFVDPLPTHPDSENPLHVNPLRRPVRTIRRGDPPAELTPHVSEAVPRTAIAEPDRIAMQPSDPSAFPPPPTPARDPADGVGDSTSPPHDARLPWPVVPAPFSPGSSPRFAPGEREPFEPAVHPPLEPAWREPLETAAEPYHVETQPRAMIRETPQPEAAAAPLESAEPVESTPAAEEGDVGTAAAPEPEERDRKEDENFDRVTVYYGTDRANLSEIERSQHKYLIWLRWAGLALIGTIGLAVMNLRFRQTNFLKFLLVACLVLTIGLGGWSAVRWAQTIPLELQPQYAYGAQLGTLKYGTCDVSIPKKHKRGKLEAPSLIWGEFQPDPEKHVKVLDCLELGEAAFYDRLRDCVADAQKKQAFVFIHGYNVSFDDAVRRTAQLAFDLEFDGAPICYSWPSRANTFYYGTDEESVRLTEDNLEIFLKAIQEKSGAEKIHLIAHSMGNRCLTAVLKSMARDLETDKPPFDEVVLTAPDVHATIFRRRAAHVVRMARHVTLYASSNDQALAMSKEYHDFPRAGETGKDGIVVLPGIDTIDVSSVDTSLVGHSYYGDNTSVLSDLFHLIEFGHPATDREWLKPKPFEDSRYWIFLKERIGERTTTKSR